MTFMGLCGVSSIKKVNEIKQVEIGKTFNKIFLNIKQNIYKYLEEQKASVFLGILLGDTRRDYRRNTRTI